MVSQPGQGPIPPNVTNVKNTYIQHHEDRRYSHTEVLGRQRELTKQDQSPIQSTDLQELLVALCTIIVH